MLLKLLPWLIGVIIVLVLIAFLAYRSQRKTVKIDPEASELGAKIIPNTAPGISQDTEIAPPSEEINVGTIKDEDLPDTHDDLTVIEGIGPAMQEILNEAGISSYRKLSMANPILLRGLLDDVGLKYVNPESWPEQARLAAQGRWEQLDNLKNQSNFYS